MVRVDYLNLVIDYCLEYYVIISRDYVYINWNQIACIEKSNKVVEDNIITYELYLSNGLKYSIEESVASILIGDENANTRTTNSK